VCYSTSQTRHQSARVPCSNTLGINSQHPQKLRTPPRLLRAHNHTASMTVIRVNQISYHAHIFFSDVGANF